MKMEKKNKRDLKADQVACFKDSNLLSEVAREVEEKEKVRLKKMIMI